MQREKIEQGHIAQLARALGAIVYVLGHASPGDGRRHRGTGQTPGLPDLLLFFPRDPGADPFLAGARQLWWEVKAPGGRLRPAQVVFRQIVGAAGLPHGVGDYDDFVAWLVAQRYARADQFPTYRRPQQLIGEPRARVEDE